MTGEQLVAWFGRQQWKPETRRFYRAAARDFFRWAYRAGRVATYRLFNLKRAGSPLILFGVSDG